MRWLFRSGQSDAAEPARDEMRKIVLARPHAHRVIIFLLRTSTEVSPGEAGGGGADPVKAGDRGERIVDRRRQSTERDLDQLVEQIFEILRQIGRAHV